MPAGGTGWHFRRRLHARKRTQRHSPATGSRLVDACARRRSGVRLPCGPPSRLRSEVAALGVFRASRGPQKRPVQTSANGRSCAEKPCPALAGQARADGWRLRELTVTPVAESPTRGPPHTREGGGHGEKKGNRRSAKAAGRASWLVPVQPTPRVFGESVTHLSHRAPTPHPLDKRVRPGERWPKLSDRREGGPRRWRASVWGLE